jgi:hypothetical protein
VSKSGRPTYAIVLFALSSLWMCATFLPLLYSVLFPNDDLRGVVHALEGRTAAAPEAAAVVQETTEAVGALTKAVPVAYYSGVTATVRVSGSQTSKQKQASYAAWFQKRSKPFLLLITVYEGEQGQKTYAISEGEPMLMVRGYSLVVLAFGVTLFLVCRKRIPATESSLTPAVVSKDR